MKNILIKQIIKEEVENSYINYINEIGEATMKPYPYTLVNTIANSYNRFGGEGYGDMEIIERYIIDSRDSQDIGTLEKSFNDVDSISDLKDSKDLIEVELEYAPEIGNSSVSFDSMGSVSAFKSTNRFKHFRIMSTIVEIIKNSIEKINKGQHPEYPLKNSIKEIVFSGEKEKGPDDNRRENFYLAYIKKQIPDSKVNLDKYGVTIELPERFYSY